jgi:hypothetical protein
VATVYRGLAASLDVVLQNGTPGCHATADETRRLLRLAQKTGEVRQDVSFDDLVCIATAVSLAAAQQKPTKARIARLVAMFVGGIGGESGAANRRSRAKT